jgi:hypothetical protein
VEQDEVQEDSPKIPDPEVLPTGETEPTEPDSADIFEKKVVEEY